MAVAEWQRDWSLVTVPYALKARKADTLTGRSSTDFVLADKLTDSVKAALKAEGLGGPTLDAPTSYAIPRFADSGGTLENSGLFALPAGPQLRSVATSPEVAASRAIALNGKSCRSL